MQKNSFKNENNPAVEQTNKHVRSYNNDNNKINHIYPDDERCYHLVVLSLTTF